MWTAAAAAVDYLRLAGVGAAVVAAEAGAEHLLQERLVNWDKTLVVVSHARSFLNAVVTDILHFQAGLSAEGRRERDLGPHTEFHLRRELLWGRGG